MHGIRGNEAEMHGLASRFDSRLLVLSVRGPLTLGPDSHAWFPVSFTPHGPQIDVQAAEAAWTGLAAFRDEAVRRYAADPDRVFLAGFSQGGIMALAGLLTSPARFAGSVCMSGRLPSEVVERAHAGVRGKPALVVHGRRDPKLPIRYAHEARDRLREMGLTVEYEEFDIAHEVTLDTLNRVATWLERRLDL